MLNKEMLLLNVEKDESGVLEAQIDTGIEYAADSICGFFDNDDNHFTIDDPGYNHTQIMKGAFPFLVSYYTGIDTSDLERVFAIKNCELLSRLSATQKIARAPEIGISYAYIMPQNPNKRCVVALKSRPILEITLTPTFDKDKNPLYPIVLSERMHGDASCIFPLKLSGVANSVTDNDIITLWDSNVDGNLVLNANDFDSNGELTLFSEFSGKYADGNLTYYDSVYGDSQMDFSLKDSYGIYAPWPE